VKNFDLMRPEKAYKEILKQRELDGKAFFEKYNGDFADVLCPACGGKGVYIFEKYGFKHDLCGNCKTLFCSPSPPEELLAVYYNSYEAPKMWTSLLIRADVERKILQYEPRVRKIVSAVKARGGENGGIALDLGAGSGAFSLCLKNTGFFEDVIALDFSESCVRACVDQGLNSLLGGIDKISSDSVDLICMNDLIEHVFDPLSLLKECFRVLRDNGFISVATPNGEGFDFKILKNRTGNITPPEHLNYFNPHSLELILTNAGFRTVFLGTPGKLDVEIILKEKISGFPLKENNEYLDHILEQDEEVLDNFQKFLSENKLSSHMLALSHKTGGRL